MSSKIIVIIIIINYFPPLSSGAGLPVPPPDSLPSKTNGPKGAKPGGVAVPHPGPCPETPLFKHLRVGEGLAGQRPPEPCLPGLPTGLLATSKEQLVAMVTPRGSESVAGGVLG